MRTVLDLKGARLPSPELGNSTSVVAQGAGSRYRSGAITSSGKEVGGAEEWRVEGEGVEGGGVKGGGMEGGKGRW